MSPRNVNKKIIDVLNEVLTAELTAINQYVVHAKMRENWGYLRLYEITEKQAIDEMKHAEDVIERVLYLNGVPNVQRLFKVNIGESIKEQLELDLTLELEAIPRLAAGITLCNDEGDHGTRHVLEEILRSEEEHVDWIEAQLDLIEQAGEGNYLAAQIRPEDD